MAAGFTNITPTSLGGLRTESEIPGTFTMKNVHIDRELLNFTLPDGWYVKRAMYENDDLTFSSGRFLLDKPDVPVKIYVAPDGSRIRIKVTDNNGEPVSGRRVNLIPGYVTRADQLVARMWSCYSDNQGECRIFSLPNETPRSVFPPGQYVVLASEIPFNQSSDVFDQIWRTMQTKGTKVTLGPGATGEATIKQEVLR